MRWWEELAVAVVVAFLKNLIKNPVKEAKVAAAVSEIASLAQQAATAVSA